MSSFLARRSLARSENVNCFWVWADAKPVRKIRTALTTSGSPAKRYLNFGIRCSTLDLRCLEPALNRQPLPARRAGQGRVLDRAGFRRLARGAIHTGLGDPPPVPMLK